MANEISINATLNVRKGNLSNSKNLGGSFTLNSALPVKCGGSPSIGFAAHEALPVVDITTCGWAWFKNLDETNYVEVGKDASGTFHAVLKFKPGESCFCRLATNAPYAKANTAAVRLEYEIYDD